MSENRGRPRKIKYNEINEVVIKYKENIILENGKFRGKAHEIWKILSQELKNQDIEVSSRSLYSYVSCNTDNIRSQISLECVPNVENVDNDEEILCESNNSSMNSQTGSDKGTRVVDIFLSKREFDNLCVTIKYNNKGGESNVCKVADREYTVLKSGEWQLVLTEKLWEKAQIKCGYQYFTHKIYLSTSRGTFDGKCSCGGTIHGEFMGKCIGFLLFGLQF